MRILNIDYLAVMDEKDLTNLLLRIRSLARKTNGKQKRSAEIELCYLQREKEIRESRRQHHYEYLKLLNQR